MVFLATIHFLLETIINQITAGEAIEGPATIVEELFLNSFDAKTKRSVVKFNSGATNFYPLPTRLSGRMKRVRLSLSSAMR
jgi:hypothetical protein